MRKRKLQRKPTKQSAGEIPRRGFYSRVHILARNQFRWYIQKMEMKHTVEGAAAQEQLPGKLPELHELINEGALDERAETIASRYSEAVKAIVLQWMRDTNQIIPGGLTGQLDNALVSQMLTHIDEGIARIGSAFTSEEHLQIWRQYIEGPITAKAQEFKRIIEALPGQDSVDVDKSIENLQHRLDEMERVNEWELAMLEDGGKYMNSWSKKITATIEGSTEQLTQQIITAMHGENSAGTAPGSSELK